MKVGIYGLGRFGSFWAECLAKHMDVCGYSRSGLKPEIPGVEQVDFETFCSCDVIVLCTAISSIEEVLGNIALKLKPGTLVMDTCSVKVKPVELMKKILPESVEIIATHPMFGPDSGKDGIKNLPFVYSPVRCSCSTAETWEGLYRSMEIDLILMSPEEHDKEAAYTQGVTHFIGRVLNGMKLKDSRIGTLGYHKILEIVEQTCNDPFQLFLDLQKYNPYTKEMRRDLSSSLEEFLKLLEIA